MKNELKEAWRRMKPTLLWTPVALAVVIGGYIVLRALDPRIGLEGFGDLFGYALNAVRGVAIVGLAWLTKRNLFFDLHDKTELNLFEGMRSLPKDKAWVDFWIVVRDRAEWAFLLAFFAWVMTR